MSDLSPVACWRTLAEALCFLAYPTLPAGVLFKRWRMQPRLTGETVRVLVGSQGAKTLGAMSSADPLFAEYPAGPMLWMGQCLIPELAKAATLLQFLWFDPGVVVMGVPSGSRTPRRFELPELLYIDVWDIGDGFHLYDRNAPLSNVPVAEQVMIGGLDEALAARQPPADQLPSSPAPTPKPAPVLASESKRADTHTPLPKPVRRKGRRKGGRYDVSDRTHFPTLNKLIADGLSVEEAARQVGRELNGAGTADNKAHRLAKLYRKERHK
jgi:hypothetical protein